MGNATKRILTLLCLGLGSSTASILRSDWHSEYRVKESHHVPEQWMNLGPAPGEHSFDLHIGLRQNNIGALIHSLYEVSTPDTLRYGRHLSKAEVDDLVRPANASIDLVSQWLDHHRIGKNIRHGPCEDWMTITVDVRTAERLLGAKYHVYRHTSDGSLLVRTPSWSLPAGLHEHVDTIQPTTSFSRLHPKAQTAGPLPPSYEEFAKEDVQDFDNITIPQLENLPNPPTPAQACNRLAISPLCLRTLYGTFGYAAKQPDGNRFAIVNFGINSNNRSDLDYFLRLYRPEAARDDTTDLFQTELVAGGIDDQTFNPDLGLEGALDAQYALALGHPTPMIAYNVGGDNPPPFSPSAFRPNNTNEPYLPWLQYLLAQPSLPQVISISYADEEPTVPPAYASRVCNMFAPLGARGVTVLVSSGDEGVGRDAYCHPRQAPSNRTTRFIPDFPASCPFVTSVGATRSLGPEVVGFDARTGFVSGGGFSDHFARPPYQEAAVGAYVDGVLGAGKHEGLWNRGGRGIPDIAASGYHYSIVWNGSTHLTDGTSASAPAVAGILALVNDALLAAGRPVLGFLNPWLYKKGWRAFTDVVHGNVTGCGTDGFPAAPGWDAASGFGTPWFPKLLELAMEDEYRPGGPRPWYMGDD